MKRTFLVLLAALVAMVVFSGCFWVEEDRRGGERGWDHEHHDRDRDRDRDHDEYRH